MGRREGPIGPPAPPGARPPLGSVGPALAALILGLASAAAGPSALREPSLAV